MEFIIMSDVICYVRSVTAVVSDYRNVFLYQDYTVYNGEQTK